MPQRGQMLLEPQTFLDRLLDDLRTPGDILVFTHDNPDPDSLSSAFGLKLLFETVLGRPTTIGYGGIIGRAENQALVRACQIPVVPLEGLEFDRFRSFALVDSQPETGNNSFPADTPIDLVVDHHPLREQTPKRTRWVDVRSDFGASATIVAQYLLQREIDFPPLLATALFYAIKSETQDLGVQANQVDRDAYFRLFPKIEPRVLFEITHPRVSPEYFRIVGDIARKTLLYGNVAFCYLGKISNPDFVAEMADFLMRLEGVEWALCIGAYERDLILSLRTSRKGGGAGQMIQRVVRGLGKAGGHGMMAGGKIVQCPEDSEARVKLVNSLRDRFLNELNVQDAEPRSMFDD